MKPLAIFRHIACEGPGYLGDFLDRHSLSYRIFKVDENEPLPESIDAFAGLVFMGGPMSVNDPLPWIAQECALIRAAQGAGVPVLGHCLGGQLISKALGGTISRNPLREIGWFPVRACAAPAARDWLHGLPSQFEVFHWHGETFSIPDRAVRILESDACANQGFVIDKTLALQCHIEMKPDMVREWARLYADEIAHPAATIQSEAQMNTDLAARVQRLQHTADILYTHWIAGLKRKPVS